MAIKFTKMHGLGNDFMVIDAINQSIDFNKLPIARLADRHTGIGFDQCLIIEPSRGKNVDFFYRIFNANGKEVGQCGNGARCLAKFVHHYGLTDKKKIAIQTQTTVMQLQLNEDGTVSVDMGLPKLNPMDIPLLVEQLDEIYTLPLKAGGIHAVHALSVGNPHAITIVADVDQAPVSTLGQEICEHPLFPQQVNAGFMEMISATHIRLRVYERGCGETNACGSGAVAAVAAGRLFYQLDERVTVSLMGGELEVQWPNFQSPIVLTGPANFVYQGELLSCVL